MISNSAIFFVYYHYMIIWALQPNNQFSQQKIQWTICETNNEMSRPGITLSRPTLRKLGVSHAAIHSRQVWDSVMILLWLYKFHNLPLIIIFLLNPLSFLSTLYVYVFNNHLFYWLNIFHIYKKKWPNQFNTNL